MHNRILERFKTDTFLYLLLFIAVFTILSILSPYSFLSKYNLQSMAFQVPEFGILALGMMLAIITGGIDLSIIANANLSAIFASLLMYNYIKVFPDNYSNIVILIILFVTCLIAGFLMGALNGILVSYMRLPAILATLGTMKIFDGISTVITGGQSLRNYPPIVAALANETFLSIPISFFIFIFVGAIIKIIMDHSRLGFRIYHFGENPVAAEYSGVNNNFILVKTYCLTGLLAGFSGLIMMSRFNSIKVGYGNSYQLLTILVAIMGGVHPSGGQGKVMNVILSTLTLQCIASGFNILGFSNYIRNVIYGVVLITVMVVITIYPILKQHFYLRNKR